ncbi:MAG: hypothetical protein ABI823_22050, partial [Bryobacteraceae bacterium]
MGQLAAENEKGTLPFGGVPFDSKFGETPSCAPLVPSAGLECKAQCELEDPRIVGARDLHEVSAR